MPTDKPKHASVTVVERSYLCDVDDNSPYYCVLQLFEEDLLQLMAFLNFGVMLRNFSEEFEEVSLVYDKLMYVTTLHLDKVGLAGDTALLASLATRQWVLLPATWTFENEDDELWFPERCSVHVDDTVLHFSVYIEDEDDTALTTDIDQVSISSWLEEFYARKRAIAAKTPTERERVIILDGRKTDHAGS